MKYFGIVVVTMALLRVSDGAYPGPLLDFGTCANSASTNLLPASTSATEVLVNATLTMSYSTMSIASSMSFNITKAGSCPALVNGALYNPSPSQGTAIIISQMNLMVDIMNGANSTCAAVNQTASQSVQANMTTIVSQVSQIKTSVQQSKWGILAFTLPDATVNMMTTMVQTYIIVMNTLVVAWRNAVLQSNVTIFLYEWMLVGSQAALDGMVFAYNVTVVTYTNLLQVVIAVANVTCNSMNTTTQIQIVEIITALNVSMSASAIFLPPAEQAAIANYTNLTITTLVQLNASITLNITYAAANLTSFFGINITAAMKNITDMGRNATVNITKIMNTTSNRAWAVFCATTSFTQIQLVVSNSSDQLGKCVSDAVRDMKNDTDECVKGFNDKAHNTTNSIQNCTAPGTHEKTDDEFKKCLEDNSDSDSKDLKAKLGEKSKKMEKGGDNEKKVKKCKEGKEDDAYYAFIAIVATFQQCVAIFG